MALGHYYFVIEQFKLFEGEGTRLFYGVLSVGLVLYYS